MPSNVIVNGGSVRRPGVYAQIDASALAGRALEIGNIAIVGEFPFLKQATPTVSTTANTMAALDPSDKTLGLLSKLCFSPAADDRIPGGPSRVYLVNALPSTKASYTFQNAAAISNLVVSAGVYGATGSRTYVKIDTVNSNRVMTIRRDGMEEVLSATPLKAGSIMFDDSSVTAWQGTPFYAASVLDYWPVASGGNAAGLRVTFGTTPLWATVLDANEVFSQFADISVSGKLTVTPNVAIAVNDALTVTIAGVDSTGAPTTEALAWAAGESVARESTKSWNSVSSVTMNTSDANFIGAGAAPGGTIAVTGYMVDLDLAAHASAKTLLDAVDASKLMTVTFDTPKLAGMLATDLDAVDSQSVNSAVIDVNATLWAMLQQLKRSGLVTAAKHADAVGPPADTADSFVLLAGGANGTAVAGDSNWQSAVNSLRGEDVQVLIPLTTASATQALVSAHCRYMAGEGGNECNAWYGAPAYATYTDLKALSALSTVGNTRHASLVFQSIKVIDQFGISTELDPSYLALLLGCMQAATDVGTPLTRKRPNIVEVLQNSSIKPDETANDLLDYGLCFLTRDRLGLKVERSITTYQTDDSPVYSEVSSNESINTSIRDLRANLDLLIGDATTPTTAAGIKSITKTRLRNQVVLGIIKAFNADGITVVDAGDTFKVNFEVAPTEPINFIQLTATVIRIASTA